MGANVIICSFLLFLNEFTEPVCVFNRQNFLCTTKFYTKPFLFVWHDFVYVSDPITLFVLSLSLSLLFGLSDLLYTRYISHFLIYIILPIKLDVEKHTYKKETNHTQKIEKQNWNCSITRKIQQHLNHISLEFCCFFAFYRSFILLLMLLFDYFEGKKNHCKRK